MRTARFCCFRGIGYTPAKTYQPSPTPDTLPPDTLPLGIPSSPIPYPLIPYPFPVNRHMLVKNITFPQIRWWEVKISVDY